MAMPAKNGKHVALVGKAAAKKNGLERSSSTGNDVGRLISAKEYFAEIATMPHQTLSPEFVESINALGKTIDAPIWLLIQNGEPGQGRPDKTHNTLDELVAEDFVSK